MVTRRSTGERRAHKTRRNQVRQARRAVGCRTGGFAFVPAAVFFSASYQARIRRQQQIAARRAAIAARRARKAGMKPFTAKQNAAFFASLCQKKKKPKPGKPPKHKHPARHSPPGAPANSLRPARSARARSLISRPRRPVAARRPRPRRG